MAAGHGSKCGIIIKNRDATRLFNTSGITRTPEVADKTMFMPPGGAREFLQGLLGSSASLGGLFAKDPVAVNAELETVVGRSEDPQKVLIAPFGFKLGYHAILLNAIRTSYGDAQQLGSIVTATSNITGDAGIKDGVVLHSPHGSGSVTQGEIQRVILTDANGPAVITESSGQTFAITPGDSNATVQAAARATADTNYDAVVVSGTQSVSAGTGKVATTGGTISASTADASHTAAHAFSDDDDEYWLAASGQTPPQSIQIVWGVGIKKYVAGLRIQSIGSAGIPIDFKIQTTTDGTTFADAGTWTGEELTGGLDEYLITAAGVRGIKLLISATNDDTRPAVHKIELIPAVYNGSYVFAFPTGVGDIDQMTTASAGYSTDTQQNYGTATNVNLVSASGTDTAVNDMAGRWQGNVQTANGATARLHVISPTPGTAGTRNLPVTIEHADDSTGSPGTWSTLVTFDAVTDVNDFDQLVQEVVIAKGTAIKPWLRCKVGVGITGSWAFAVALARR